jgi:hypothetical protein
MCVPQNNETFNGLGSVSMNQFFREVVDYCDEKVRNEWLASARLGARLILPFVCVCVLSWARGPFGPVLICIVSQAALLALVAFWVEEEKHHLY